MSFSLSLKALPVTFFSLMFLEGVICTHWPSSFCLLVIRHSDHNVEPSGRQCFSNCFSIPRVVEGTKLWK